MQVMVKLGALKVNLRKYGMVTGYDNCRIYHRSMLADAQRKYEGKQSKRFGDERFSWKTVHY
jgi:hypothetical protein